MRKPGAFKRYNFRRGIFPAEGFRWAHDELCASCKRCAGDAFEIE